MTSWIAYEVRSNTGGVLGRVHSLEEAERVAARFAGGAPVEIVLTNLTRS